MHETSPPSSWVYASVGDLIAGYRARRVSPGEVLEELLQRIEAIDPELKAFLGRTDELAREQASAAEQAYRRGDAGPLCGVPVSIKDTFPVEGYPTTFGSLAYASNVSLRDSGVVRRLRAAGAVFTGKTNTSEFAQSATTENRFADDCHNPWDIRRTAGGSSGGAAASVAAGLSSIAVGADGGGSIRIPAAFTGLFGLKPTYGLCADEGGLDAMSDFISPGPLARRVADARIMLGVLVGGAYPRSATRERLRIAWCARPGGRPHERGVEHSCESAVRKLAELGHDVEERTLDLEGWEKAFATLVLHNEHRERGQLLDDCPDSLTGYARRSLERGRELTAADVEEARRRHSAYRDRIRGFFDDYDLLVLPTTASPAFRIGQRPTEIDGQQVHWLWGAFPCTAPFNVSGNPAATLPCGLAGGLPVGLQIVAADFEEARILDVAEELEEALPLDRSVLVERWAGSGATLQKG